MGTLSTVPPLENTGATLVPVHEEPSWPSTRILLSFSCFPVQHHPHEHGNVDQAWLVEFIYFSVTSPNKACNRVQ